MTNWMGGKISEDEGRSVRKILREAGERDAAHIETMHSRGAVFIRIEAPTVGFSPKLREAITDVFRGSIVQSELS